ncbi:hypothetical protein [Homoserinibacter sp. GY 40078]|uniref:hypothetical protein n=1 Tax=Homoserinibacter sp. GY 40078 TaxID=2603275 RepID=UPI0011C7B0B9|nr:hypothetical protein [Homoserinibacter sp. GY 40078]TXK19321.1 hypothetical protein FVQ89_05245 [Homoserinibacter sp. GY 40078]
MIEVMTPESLPFTTILCGVRRSLFDVEDLAVIEAHFGADIFTAYSGHDGGRTLQTPPQRFELLESAAISKWPYDADLWDPSLDGHLQVWAFLLLASIADRWGAEDDLREGVGEVVETLNWVDELHYLVFYARNSKLKNDAATIRQELADWVRTNAGRYGRLQ